MTPLCYCSRKRLRLPVAVLSLEQGLTMSFFSNFYVYCFTSLLIFYLACGRLAKGQVFRSRYFLFCGIPEWVVVSYTICRGNLGAICQCFRDISAFCFDDIDCPYSRRGRLFRFAVVFLTTNLTFCICTCGSNLLLSMCIEEQNED